MAASEAVPETDVCRRGNLVFSPKEYDTMPDDKSIEKPVAEHVKSAEYTRGGHCFRPDVDILEGDDELIVLVDVPGASGDQIDVGFEGGILSIHAHVEPSQDADAKYLLREYDVGDYHRTFQVSESTDAGKITAQCTDGVLKLRLPKSEAARPRKIAVETG